MRPSSCDNRSCQSLSSRYQIIEISRRFPRGASIASSSVMSKHFAYVLVIEFADERRAVAFERYLKSGSGVAFASRHLR